VMSEHRPMRFVREFSPGFTAEGRRTRVEPVNLVRPIIHIMQHHLSHILRCVTVCGRL